MKRKAIERKVEKIVLESYEEMYRLAYCYVRNEQDAMDIVQESVYKCIYHAKEIRQEQYIRTWMWRVVMNTALDWKKKQEREFLMEVSEEMQPVVEDEQKYDLENAFHTLKESEQRILDLYYFEGFKLEEIADMLEINISTLKSTLYRSLRKMRKVLEGREAG